jgi:hypothetical protein
MIGEKIVVMSDLVVEEVEVQIRRTTRHPTFGCICTPYVCVHGYPIHVPYDLPIRLTVMDTMRRRRRRRMLLLLIHLNTIPMLDVLVTSIGK